MKVIEVFVKGEAVSAEQNLIKIQEVNKKYLKYFFQVYHQLYFQIFSFIATMEVTEEFLFRRSIF